MGDLILSVQRNSAPPYGTLVFPPDVILIRSKCEYELMIASMSQRM